MAISKKTCAILCFFATGGFCLPELAGTAIWSRALCLVFVGRLHSALRVPVDAMQGEVEADRSSKETSGYSIPHHHSCAEGASMSTEDSRLRIAFLCIPQGNDPGSNSEAAAPMAGKAGPVAEGYV